MTSNVLMVTLALGTLPALGLGASLSLPGFLLRYIACLSGYLVSDRKPVIFAYVVLQVFGEGLPASRTTVWWNVGTTLWQLYLLSWMA